MRSIFLLRGRQIEKLASGAAAGKVKNKDKGKRNSGNCVQWTTTCQCFRGDKCDPETLSRIDVRIQRKRKGKGSRPSSSPLRNSSERGTPSGKSPSGKEKPANMLSFGKGDCLTGQACDYWHTLECSFHRKGDCKLGSWCASKHTEKAGTNQRNKKNLW